MSEPLFPPGCSCLSYGHGVTMTRVHSPRCPVHGAKPVHRMTEHELRAGVNEFTQDDPPPYTSRRERP